MLRGFCRVIVLVFAMGMVWGCGGERVTQSQMVEGEEEVGRPLSKLAVQTSASHAVVVATVLRDDAPVIWAKVAFSRSIAGQAADYQWSGVTDESGIGTGCVFSAGFLIRNPTGGSTGKSTRHYGDSSGRR